MEMTKYIALFDELEKIAEAEKEKPAVTKERFKRHLKTLVPTALGAGLGTAAGYGTLALAKKHNKKINALMTKHPRVAKGLPLVVGAMGAAGGMLRGIKDRKVKDYIVHGND